MEIITIDETSPYLDEVIALGKVNANTLGFLPKGAYTKHAADNHIFVALDEGKEVLGYLLYAISSKKRLAYIVHLCVRQSQQGQGVARALFEEVKVVTKDEFSGIRVRCRRDYEASTLWPKLGFVATHEMPGRSKHGTTLTVWWFDHDHPTLFSYADQQRPESRLRVAIDANVFYQLQHHSTPTNEESRSLLADWLQENIELCITSELLNEIDRHDDEQERKQGRAFASTFPMLSSVDKEFQKIRQELRHLFPEQMSTSDESDLRQLARSIAAGVQFFVTRDSRLLEKEDQIYEGFGLHVTRPSDLVVNQDQIMRESEYQPVRLAGSQIKIERVRSGQSSFLEDMFRAPQEETKADLRQRLLLYLSDPHTFEANIIHRAEQPLALIVYGCQNQKELEIPLLRVVQNSLSATLVRHLILHSVLISSREDRILTKITDPYLHKSTVDALQEMGFVAGQEHWVKVNLPIVATAQESASRLDILSSDLPQASQHFQHMRDTLLTTHSLGSIPTMLQVERALWPAKLVDIDIPTFIVPIRPEWAMHLFDPGIASQDLFGGEPSLIFNVENVYYRASRPKVLSAPGRLLWYVSKGAGKYQETKSIRACSYLDEVIVANPKTLFSQFRRLGVYKWEEVFSIADMKVDNEIMAFRFSLTEVFTTPISRSELDSIWQEETGRKFHILPPVSIPRERFFRLYEMGVKTC